MNLTPLHLAILAGGLLLAAAVITVLIARRSRTVQPVYCIHCWVHNQQVTVVTHSSKGGRWAICQDCVGLYWYLEGADSIDADSDRSPEQPSG